MILSLAALIGFAVYSEIRQRTRTPVENRTDQIEQEQPAEPDASLDTGEVAGPRKIDLDLLNEASWGRTENVRLLLESGADINTRDTNGDTPLIAAAFMGYNETVKLLLEKGAEVNAQNNLGSTALMEAATMNKPETVAMLLSNGADTKAKNIAGLTALDAALRDNNVEMARLLRSGVLKKPAEPSPYASLDDGLHQAVKEGDLAKVRSLLAGGANANARNKDGRTALILAAMQGRADIVQALLNGGADPNAKDKNGNTAMSVVQESGQRHIGYLLKQAGAKTPAYNQILSKP
jgi:ankyrin repeat protein